MVKIIKAASDKLTLHIKQLIEVFALGVLDADPYHASYEPPPRFGEAMRVFSRLAHMRFPTDTGVIHATSEELGSFMNFACGVDLEGVPVGGINHDHGVLLNIMQQWNIPEPQVRQIIDIDAVVLRTMNRLKCCMTHDRMVDRS